MKLEIATAISDKTGYRYVKAFAVIPKGDGVPRRYQKTWKIRTVAPSYAVEEMRHSFEANARRWEEKVLARIQKERELSEAVHAVRRQQEVATNQRLGIG